MTIVWTATNTNKIQRTGGNGATRSATMRVVQAMARAFDLGRVHVLETIADTADERRALATIEGG